MAYTTSDKYKEVIYSGDNDNNLSFRYGDDYVEDSSPYISSLKLTNNLLKETNTTFSLDNFVANKVEIIVHDYPIEDLTKEFYFELGSMVDGAYEYVPLGYYKIKDNPTTANGKTTYKLFDRTINFDFNYDASTLINNNGGSVTILQLLQDMCSKAGVELATTDFIGKDKLIGVYDNTITARAYVSYIAELACSIAKIGRDGKLYLIPIKKENNNAIEIDEEFINQKMASGDTFKASRVVFESGVVQFSKGDESADTLFINASNPYITTQQDIDNIYNQIVGFEIHSLNTDKTIGNVAIDAYDFIKFNLTDDNGDITKTILSLGQYDFTFNGAMTQKFKTTINRTSKVVNASVASPNARYKRLTQEIDAVDASLKIVREEVDSNTSKITSLEIADGEFGVQVSNIEKGIIETNQNVSSLQASLDNVSADFEDFKDNEFVNSIGNLQDQIDGAIQFWNGEEIPTINNYPANEWETEEERNNHRADIYTVIEDVDGELKQGKAYRFDKVGDVWQWIELTDNELSAVQAIAQEALDKAKANAGNIDVLTEKTSELIETDEEIRASVTEINNKYEQDITLERLANGNPIIVRDAGPYKLESTYIEGESYQDGTPTPDAPIKIQNIEGVTNYLPTDVDDWEQGTISQSTGENLAYTNRLRTKNYIEVEELIDCYASLENTSYKFVNIILYDASKVFVKAYESIDTSFIGSQEKVVNFPSGIKYVRFSIRKNDDSDILPEEIKNIKPQMVLGNKKKDYVPFGRWLEQKTISENLANFETNTTIGNLQDTGVVDTTKTNYETSDYIKVKPNTTYRYKLKNLYVPATETSRNCTEYNSSKEYVVVSGTIVSTKIEYKSITFTTSTTTEYVRLSKRISDEEVELVEENTARIDLNKKNLFDASNPINAFPSSIIGEVVTYTDSTASITYKNCCDIEKGKSYIIKWNENTIHNNTSRGSVITNNEGVILQNLFYNPSYKLFKFNATTNGILHLTMDINTTDIKIYEGIETDDYYRLASIGDTKDTFKDGVLTQKIGKVVLDGSETYYLDTTKEITQVFTINNNTIPNLAPYKKVLSTHFKTGVEGDTEKISLTDTIYIAINKTKASTIDEFKAYLKAQYDAGTPVEVEYELATPIEHTLNYKVLELHEGYNNITTNDELEPNMEIRYLTDSKLNARYASKADLQITAERITSEINQTLKNEYTTLEQTNKIEQKITDTENEILLEVGKKVTKEDYNTDKENLQNDIDSKVAEKDFTGANILLAINGDQSEAQINADKISLKGKEINLTTDNVKITSNNTSIDEEGNMNVIGGTQEEPHFKVYRENNTAEVDITPDSIIIKNTIANSNKVMNLDDDGSYYENLRVDNFNRQIGIPNGLFNEIYEEGNGITSQYMTTDSDGVHSSRINAKELIVDNVDVLGLASMITKLGLITKIGIGANTSGHFYIRGIVDDNLMYQLNCTSTDLRFQKYENGTWATIWTK